MTENKAIDDLKSDKNQILMHLKSIQHNLPEFISLIERTDEERNSDAYWEVKVKVRDMDYWMARHLEISQSKTTRP